MVHPARDTAGASFREQRRRRKARHLAPTAGGLFTSIKRDSAVQIESLATHVARSRGITLRYRASHKGSKPWVAYANRFETDGFVFDVQPSLLNSSEDWDPSSAPFNVDSIKLLEHHLQSHPSLAGQLNGFLVQHIIRALVLHIVRNSADGFEETIGSVVSILRETSLSEEITQAYVDTLAESIREFVSDDFDMDDRLLQRLEGRDLESRWPAREPRGVVKDDASEHPRHWSDQRSLALFWGRIRTHRHRHQHRRRNHYPVR